MDEALEALGLQREIITVVGGFSAALALARASDLIATVPARHTQNLRTGLHSFDLPFELPPITISMLWHPRMDADSLHAFPLSDVVLGATTTDTQFTTELANGNTRIFDILGHGSTSRRALGRQALLPVAAIGALTLLFRIKLHMGRDRADEYVRFI
jgi:hypothetical protein